MKKEPPVMFYKKSVLKYFTKFPGKRLCLNALFLISSRPEVFMKRETPTQVFSSWFYEIFKNSSGRLLLSMKETKNCLCCRDSCKYDSTVKNKDLLLTKLGTMIVKINAVIASTIFLQSALRRQLSITCFIHMSAAVVTWRVQNTFLD